ncbi:hypothetical protein DTO013E5_3263 [Penicillium roqueforti]|uniref:H/ACA ribonucleoprotein complex non-core subunit NAF1 n=1 Tax=Penicillium roqueforti (strain FM164) TaxID=1365484 RepID=W6QZ62_PENRF|nr:uncharacterized protein LCP9604111_5969 [Penicillium roqueforti]CDM34827.1 H/ACA ribonucleoprotein complex, subunit Gar1/Naf1 [Penicillium roqueforti FM164]KAF9247779.1 hypothetical protein LCP9604111_5969 [Penicillium roqueforti]KAI2678084.1 hypothetical protein CBS147355_5085 [Penicillium roqueforti]KAI2686567.1 hypothetical protein LCP963914a_4167 [Penicillium roqueforti]KAI2704447.1 hypothetical protein CBS147372_2916 [Penicillium roqueforti]
MDGHQNPATDSTGAGEGPASKKPCLIETPIAGSQDIGATSLNAGDSTTEKPSHIPGLNLIQHSSDEQTGSALTEHTIKQEQEQDQLDHQEGETENQQAEIHLISQHEPTEVMIKKETEANHFTNEPTAPLSEAMDVAQDNHQDNMIEATGQAGDVEEEEHPEWEVDSSPYESSSDSSDSSDSDDSDDEDYPILSAEEQAQILMRAEGGSDDEGDGKGKPGGQLRTTNEIEHEVLPVPDVKITPEMKIVFLGKVHAAIDNNVLIEANTSGEYQVLESGSLLCSADRQIIGVVAETLGRVENPLYTVTYATASEVQEKGLVKGKDIFYVEGHSTFVFTQPLKGMKGSDASNFHDEEVAAEEMEFSDDEAEAEYKRKLKQRRLDRKEAREGPKGKKPAPGPSKLNQTELNYDDAGGEEGYTPLARPTNFHEMMRTREPPVEGNERGGFRGRGRGRGDRGRGDRARGGRGRGGRGGREWDQDRRPQQASGSIHEPQPQPQAQPTATYGQPMYQQPQQPYGMPQPFAAYAQYTQQAQNPQQPQFGQGGAQPQMPFQFSPYPAFQQPQPNNFQNMQQGAAQFNPQSLALLQQQQQQQFLQLLQHQQHYQQSQQHYQQPQQQPQQHQPPQAQNPAMNFDQVKAQLDLLRNLSGGNQGPPPS